MNGLIRIFAIIACAGLSIAPPDKITKESIVTGGLNRTYYLYVPPEPSSQPMPLVVLLHGSGRRGDSLVTPWKDLAKKEGVVLAAPDSLDPRGWVLPEDGPQFLFDVAENLRKTQKIDARRMYVFGHSAGAVFALSMGLLESRYFAAVAVHAGAFRTREEFAALDQHPWKRNIPFAVWLGTADQFFPMSAARRTRDAFVEAGLPFQLNEIAWHDHNYYDSAKAINREVWAFFRAHGLDADPKYDRYNFR